jgi:hypothetical protein
MAFTQGLDGATIRRHYDRGGPERILDFTLRTGPFGDRYGENPDGVTLDKLKAQPNGINFGPMVPQVPRILGTGGRQDPARPGTCSTTCPARRALDRAPDGWCWSAGATARSNNSWLHNVGPLMKEAEDRCTLITTVDGKDAA